MGQVRKVALAMSLMVISSIGWARDVYSLSSFNVMSMPSKLAVTSMLTTSNPVFVVNPPSNEWMMDGFQFRTETSIVTVPKVLPTIFQFQPEPGSVNAFYLKASNNKIVNIKPFGRNTSPEYESRLGFNSAHIGADGTVNVVLEISGAYRLTLKFKKSTSLQTSGTPQPSMTPMK